MAPQRIITVDQSVRVLKFIWWTLQLEPDGVTCAYFTISQAEITAKAAAYNLHECMDWPAPYTKGVSKLKILFKCVKTYLSRGNVEGPLDQWIVATEGDDPGNKEAVRTFLRGGGAQFEDTVTIRL